MRAALEAVERVRPKVTEEQVAEAIYNAALSSEGVIDGLWWREMSQTAARAVLALIDGTNEP